MIWRRREDGIRPSSFAPVDPQGQGRRQTAGQGRRVWVGFPVALYVPLSLTLEAQKVGGDGVSFSALVGIVGLTGRG